MLEPDGAVMVTEAFRATPPLQRWTTTTVRGIVALVVITPILPAVGWLLWPTVRAKLASRRSLKAIRGHASRQ